MPYFIQTPDGTEFPIDITNRIDFNFANAVTVYESIGLNGGFTINNGRLNSSVSLNVSLATKSLNEGLAIVNRLKNITQPVIIAGKSKNLGILFGRYTIESIPGNIEDGNEMIRFTINLREYRQANVKRILISAVYQGDSIVDFLSKNNFLAG
jgi:hypothetical protein